MTFHGIVLSGRPLLGVFFPIPEDHCHGTGLDMPPRMSQAITDEHSTLTGEKNVERVEAAGNPTIVTACRKLNVLSKNVSLDIHMGTSLFRVRYTLGWLFRPTQGDSFNEWCESDVTGRNYCFDPVVKLLVSHMGVQDKEDI